MSPRLLLAMHVLALAVCAGCQQGPFAAATAQPAATSTAYQQQTQSLTAQVQDLNRRVSQLDVNNADLHRQLAQHEQAKQAAENQVRLLQQQIDVAARQARESLLAKQEADKQVTALQASTRARGGATITANSSIRQSLATIAIPGLDIRQDGAVIRIEIPGDKLFLPGASQIQADGYRILDEVAAAVQRSYPRQRIVVEAHTDDALASQPTAAHSLTTAQAQAVFTQLVQRGRVPARQLSILAMGDNHPLASNATPVGKAKNRRVEIVVYPDTLDG
ncbi:MAG TPA: OmpA family protein [Pirellulaceae bacterium]|nr:OmpA family protein [Pirellulaceae bacterium]